MTKAIENVNTAISMPHPRLIKFIIIFFEIYRSHNLLENFQIIRIHYDIL